MANHPQAAKRNRQRIKRQSLARHFRSTMRSCIKRVRAAIKADDRAEAEAAFKEAGPALDRAAQKGMLPKERAARFVSRLALAINKLSA